MTASMDQIEILELQAEYKKIHDEMTRRPAPSTARQIKLQFIELFITERLRALGSKP